MRKSKLLVLFLVALLVIFATVGCRPEETPDPTPPPAQDPAPENGMTYEDGSYTGESEVDDRGWKGVVEIVVEDGNITEVNFDELDEEGGRKSENEDYNQRWKEQSDISADEAYPAYEDALIETQDIDEVDVITGATSTFGKFVKAVENALEQGETGNN